MAISSFSISAGRFMCDPQSQLLISDV